MNEIKVKLSDFKTPQEIVEMFPDCNITTRDLGYLCMAGAIKGKHFVRWMVYLPDFLRYLEYIKQRPVYID